MGSVDAALRLTSDTYDRIADVYAARSADVSLTRRAYLDRFVAAVRRGGLVLDAGSGPGQLAALLAEQGLRPVALDSSVEMLRLARLRVPAVGGDLRRLPFAAASLDGVWSAASLLHVPREDVPATLRGWRTVLRPGGVLGLSTAVGRDDQQGWERVPYAAGGQSHDVPQRRWFVYHSAERLHALVADAGFDVLDSDVRESHRVWLQLVARVRPQGPGKVDLTVM